MKNVIPIYLPLVLCLILIRPSAFAQQNTNQYNVEVAWGAKVNTFSGNLLFREVLFDIPSSTTPLELSISYNSLLKENNWGMGPGWTMSENLFYQVLASGDISLRRADGRSDKFTKNGSTYDSPASSYEELELSSDTVRIKRRNNTVYEFADSSHKKITSLKRPNGNRIDYSYDSNGKLASLTDPYGRSIYFGWSGGKLRTIREENGSKKRSWFFSYNGDLLAAISFPAKKRYEFTYNEDKLLQQIINPLGHSLEIGYYRNCAVSRVHLGAVGMEMNFSYDAGSRICSLEEQVGAGTQSSTFSYDASGRLASYSGSCCGADVSYEYDAIGNVSRKTDANGNDTRYAYDTRGNLLKQKNAFGDSITWMYDPVINCPITKTDYNGNTTSYTYDSEGNLTSVIHPTAAVQKYGYNAAGRQLYSVNEKGDTTHYAYNASNFMTSQVSPLGITETFTYDNLGHRTSYTDGNGNTTTYDYDDLDRLIRLTQPISGSHTFQYTYDAAGNKTSETNEDGLKTTFQYDALGRIVTSTAPLGKTWLYSYDQKNLLGEIDPNGNSTTYAYDAKNRLISQTNAGGTRSYTYDAQNNLLSRTDALGRTTSYSYDALNRKISTTNPLGDTESITFDANGNKTSETDFAGNTSSLFYNSRDWQTKIISASGDSVSFTYDAAGNQVSIINPRGNMTLFGYDKDKRRTFTVNALGDTVKYEYDNVGNVIREVDPSGRSTRYTYDAAHRILSEYPTSSEITQYTYTGSGKLLSTTYPNGNVETQEFDLLGRVTRSSDNLGQIEKYTYDANDNILTIHVGIGDSTVFYYDFANRNILNINPKGDSISYTYDAEGNRLSMKNAEGQITKYQYDGLNRLTEKIDPALDTIRYTYDAMDRIVQLENPKGGTTTYDYDAIGRLIREEYDDGSETKFAYDAGGNMIRRIDPNGDTLKMTYDALDRLIKKDYPGSNDDFYAYDKASRLDSAWNTYGVVTFSYDSAGRVIGDYRDGIGSSKSHDMAGATTSFTFPQNFSILESYDARGRLTSLKKAASLSDQFVAYTYDLNGQKLSSTQGNGTESVYVYDELGNMTSISHRNPGSFWDVDYTYDKDGNRLTTLKNHRTTHSEQYLYDDIQRLTDFRVGTLSGGNIPAPTRDVIYSLDDNGNLTQISDNLAITSFSTNSMNQYLTLGAASPTYDPDGNMTFDGSQYYFYDMENRLIKLSSDAAGLLPKVTYQYDALGRLIKRDDGVDATLFYYDGDRIVESRNSSDTTIYIYGISMDEHVCGITNGVRIYYHQDILNSVVSLTDNSGTVVEQIEFDAYGEPSFLSSGFVSKPASSYDNKFLFSSALRDDSSGLYYMRARWFKPDIGSFTSPDPDGLADDPRNVYTYSFRNPISWTDPSGRGRVEAKATVNMQYNAHERAVLKGGRNIVTKNQASFPQAGGELWGDFTNIGKVYFFTNAKGDNDTDQNFTTLGNVFDRWYFTSSFEGGDITTVKYMVGDQCHERKFWPVTMNFRVTEREPTKTLGLAHGPVSGGISWDEAGVLLMKRKVQLVYTIDTQGNSSVKITPQATEYFGLSQKYHYYTYFSWDKINGNRAIFGSYTSSSGNGNIGR